MGQVGKASQGPKTETEPQLQSDAGDPTKQGGIREGSIVPMGAQHIQAAPLSNERNIEHNAEGRNLILGNAASLTGWRFRNLFPTTVKGQN